MYAFGTSTFTVTMTQAMPTRVLPVDPVHPEPGIIAQGADCLRAGRLVAFPTETVYGLGASALDAAAVARIYAAKGRPAHNPVIVHVGDIAQARSLVTDWPDQAELLAARFWPGPLTLVLPRSAQIPDIVAAGGPTVALRWPAHPVAQALIRTAGVPVAAPSANRSMHISPTRAEHVLRSLSGKVDLVLDGGPTPGGIESTVLDVTTTPPRLLRPGLITAGQIEQVVGAVRTGSAANPIGEREALPSPGMLPRHYAPRVPLEVVASSQQRVHALLICGERIGWLCFEDAPDAEDGVIRLVMPAEPAEYAAQLYAALHTLDALDVTRIVVERPPEGDAWAAIHDRLRRASTPA